MQSQPIDFHPPAEEAAAFLLPVTASLFADRADRFDALAVGGVSLISTGTNPGSFLSDRLQR